MKETIKNNKKVFIISIAIILLFLIGIAFAYLTTTIYGEKSYLVRAGSLELRLEEGNELTLEKQIPLEDSEGMKLNGFNFSLINEGKISTDYTIYLDDIELGVGETRMPDSAIRYSLTKNDVVGNVSDLSSMGTNPNRVVDKGSVVASKRVNYNLKIWIDYDATTEEASGKTFKAKLRVVAKQSVGEKVSTVLLDNIPEENQFDDGVDTFITGEDPNNYIWYSGKLWRAVSINNEAKTTKLVTQWNISTISYNASGNTAFSGSHMEMWLNDTSADGFLGNLRDYENFIVTDAVWDATMDDTELGSITRPNRTTIVNQAVGLLNMYEYQSSYRGTDYSNSYLNNGVFWWTLTPYSSSNMRYLTQYGSEGNYTPNSEYGVRPSLNLKSNVKIVDGDGTVDNPYRLSGDNDTVSSGGLLNTRYSGEYITFGTGENTLYRIVSHEVSGLTKITSAEPLKSGGSFITRNLGSLNYSSTTTMGTFLNGDYLTNYVGDNYANMIEDSTIWYLGKAASGTNYRLAKYSDTNMSSLTLSTTSAKVGLLRLGELMTGQFNSHDNNTTYWMLTSYNSVYGRGIFSVGNANTSFAYDSYGVRPSLNLKSNVIITGGTGTKEDPFQIELAS